MEAALKTVVTTFFKSSKGQDLSGKSFRKLIEENLGGVMEDSDNRNAIKEMQQGLDENSDGKVSFQEYMVLIGHIAKSFSRQKCEASAGGS